MPSKLDSTAPNGDVENEFILSDNSGYVKKKLSRQADEGSYSFITKDSDGTELSMEQAEYFKNSQVLDYADNLRVMYQLANDDLSDLDRSISTGFVFTENKQRVKQDGELNPYYLNIKNPILPDQRKITKEQMLKFLKAIESDSYDYDFSDIELGATAESVLDSVWGKSDYEMLLEAGGEGFEEVLSYYAEPLAKKIIYDKNSKLDYSLEGAAYSFAGGFIGSAIFGSGADVLGMRKSPATEISLEAEKSVKKLQTELVRNGFSDMKKVSKLLSEAESLVKQASWFDNETQKFVLPENLATIFEDAKTVKYNPKTIEAVKLKETYKGVTPGKVDFEVKEHAVAFGKKSIITLPDGKKFVKASRKVISGDNPETWASDVMKYINNEIRHGKDVSFTGIDGEVLTITRDTAGKARFRNTVQEKGGVRRALSDDEYALKLRVESHIDEIAQVSKGNNAPLTPDRKNHPFAKDGFKYRTAFFEDFDGQYYYIRFSVGHTGEVKTVYNVGQIKNRNGTPSFGSKAARQDAAKVTHSYNESISQQNPIVNAKLAISHRTVYDCQ